MNILTIRSILVATALGEAAPGVIRSAVELAARAGAALHVVHVMDLAPRPFSEGRANPGRGLAAAEERLSTVVASVLNGNPAPASQQVIDGLPHAGVLRRASEVAADLLVIGAHRGPAFGAHVLGTTADRLIRAAEIPCFVVRKPIALPVGRIGVPIDFSDPAGGALDLALGWAEIFGREDETAERATEVRVLYVAPPIGKAPDLDEGWIGERLDEAIAASARRTGPDSLLRVEAEIRRAERPAAETSSWSEEHEIDLLVLGTHGHTGLQRALIGSVAAALAREAPCSVLLVPPSLRRGLRHEETVGPMARLDRLVVGIDFTPGSEAAAAWVRRHFAPGAEQVLVHSIDLPQTPRFLQVLLGEREKIVGETRREAERRLEEIRGRLPEGPTRILVQTGGAADCISATAAQEAADLIVVGEHRRGRGVWSVLGTTAERVLHAAPVPVLVARELPPGEPHRLLVAVDESPIASTVLAWARLFSERWTATVTIFHVVNLFGYRYIPPGSDSERDYLRRASAWLHGQVRAAGIPDERADLRVTVGDPGHEILSAAARFMNDLIIMGTRGAGTLGRTLVGSVAAAVLQASSCPVLIVTRPSRAHSADGAAEPERG